MRNWLAAHGETVSEPAWRARQCRLAHPLLGVPRAADPVVERPHLSLGGARDHLARAARHLDRVADKTRPGVGQLVAWTGIVAASLLMPEGKPRQLFGEAGLRRVLGGRRQRRRRQCRAVAAGAARGDRALSISPPMLRMRRVEVPPSGRGKHVLARRCRRCSASTHGDGGSAAGRAPARPGPRYPRMVDRQRRAHPAAAQARHWGYQRVARGKACCPSTPRRRRSRAGAPGGLRLDAGVRAVRRRQRMIVNCGGAAAARGTVAEEIEHAASAPRPRISTLTIGDSQFDRRLRDGALGNGVGEVERRPRTLHSEKGSPQLASKRATTAMRRAPRARPSPPARSCRPNGRELRGEDAAPRTGQPAPARQESSRCASTSGPRSRPARRRTSWARCARQGGPMWQFLTSEGTLAVEESLWVDGEGRPHRCEQLVVTGTAPAGGVSIGWIFQAYRVESSSLWRSHGGVADGAQRQRVDPKDGGGAATVGPSPLRQRFALPPPHRCATGRINGNRRPRDWAPAACGGSEGVARRDLEHRARLFAFELKFVEIAVEVWSSRLSNLLNTSSWRH